MKSVCVLKILSTYIVSKTIVFNGIIKVYRIEAYHNCILCNNINRLCFIRKLVFFLNECPCIKLS